MRNLLASMACAMASVVAKPVAATTIDIASLPVGQGFLTPEIDALLTVGSMRADSLTFLIDTTVTASFSSFPNAPGVGEAVTVEAFFFLTPAGQARVKTASLVAVQQPLQGFSSFHAVSYDTQAALLTYSTSGAGVQTLFSLDGSNCGLASGATLIDFANAANTGCATYSGGPIAFPGLTTAAASVSSASFTLAAVPLPAFGGLYGAMLLGAGCLAMRRRAKPVAA